MSMSKYFIAFYLVWTIRELVFGSIIQDASFLALLVKLIVWIVPVFIYLKFDKQVQDPIYFLRLKKNVLQGITWGMIISAVLAVLEGIIIYGSHGRFHINLGWRWLTTPLFAFPEEVVFRGFLLQNLICGMEFTKSNLISSLLFVSIHFPIWFSQGMTIAKFIFNGFMIFFVGYGLGYLMKRTNSLWATTIVHSVYNLLIYLR